MIAIDQQMAKLTRGCEAVYSQADLKAKLASGKTLRIKLGLDPTAPDIHLGHSVVLRKMRQFQDLGHTAVLIIGDYTARIGDPTGRDTTRPILSAEQVDAHAQTYLDQAGIILDTSAKRLEIRRNSEWLSPLTFADVLKLTGQMTVQQMLHREAFRKRVDSGNEIMITEFMYPLMQAYDSVMIDADVELGGTDQTFNNLCGRDLMAKADKPRQVVMVLPLLVGLDGTEKMSKSKGNYVGLTDAPDDMFGKVMSIPDDLMRNYFTLLTDLPMDRVESLCDATATHPRQAKEALGKAIVEQYHDAAAAAGAAEEFTRRFAQNELPSDIATKSVDADSMPAAKVVKLLGFASSNSEARRLISQGAVTWGDEKVTDPVADITITDEPTVLKVGKRRVCRVVRA